MLTMIGALIGGIGLFLLGMRLMTEGLKLAAGETLRQLLSRGTRTPLHGLLSGIVITSLVQSSSAVIVATIGFVNAGLMTLIQAITVIYGSNVGTTMTSWLVTLVGFNINIKAFSLPMIGIGMLLRLIGGAGRKAAIGDALAGFGIFFLGIDILKTTFSAIGGGFHLTELNSQGVWGLFLFVGVGFLLTLLMQSSSAALAIILTAAGGHVIPLTAAAALVIGANMGTTSTAVFATLGATPNAKRVASAHVAFNLITGVIAVLLLPFMLMGLTDLRRILNMDVGPVALLALFHSAFNVLGVMLMWPLTSRLVKFLERRFRSGEENEARPRYLDRNIVGTPSLAMNALAMELVRIGGIARRMAKGAISSEMTASPQLARDARILTQLVDATGNFSNLIQRGHLPPDLDDKLPNALRVSRYYTEMAELAEGIAHAQSVIHPIDAPELETMIADFKHRVVHFLTQAEPAAERYTGEGDAAALAPLQQDYQQLKSRLLRAGTQGVLPVRTVVDQLDLMSNIRRIAEQAEKSARYLSHLIHAAHLNTGDQREHNHTEEAPG
ncbi:MAG TPA: Na+/phosphate symporter [Betaproteobacteria bacterium]|nr:Na+/phosphate symporter [Betaproteobacteria bacterium]